MTKEWNFPFEKGKCHRQLLYLKNNRIKYLYNNTEIGETYLAV